jgi:O-antigen/teichoic acid export membrane protein
MFQRFNLIKIWLDNKILKDSALMIVSQIIGVFIGFFTTILISRSLGVENYGYYLLILSYVNIGQITALPGFSTIIHKGGIKNYDCILIISLKRIIPIVVISAILLAIVGFLIYSDSETKQLGLVLMLTALALPLLGLEKYDALLTGKRQYKISRFLFILNALLTLIVVGGTAYYTKNEVFTYMSFLGLKIFMLIIGYLFVINKWKDAEINKKFEKDSINQAWKYTWVVGFSNAVNALDKVILGTMNPVMLAVYHIGSLLPKQISNIFKVVVGVVNAYWGNLKKENNMFKINKYLWKMFFILLFLTSIMWTLIPFVINLFFGKEYEEASKIAQWLILVIPLNMISALVYGYNIYQDDGIFFRNQQIIKSIFYLVLLIPLVYFYQIFGVVASILMRDGLFGIVAIFFFYKTFKDNETKTTYI